MVIHCMEYEYEYPEDYICPITMDLMLNPVRASDGYIYDKVAILDWYRMNKESPFTREMLTPEFVVQNNLKDEIKTFIDENKIDVRPYVPKNVQLQERQRPRPLISTLRLPPGIIRYPEVVRNNSEYSDLESWSSSDESDYSPSQIIPHQQPNSHSNQQQPNTHSNQQQNSHSHQQHPNSHSQQQPNSHSPQQHNSYRMNCPLCRRIVIFNMSYPILKCPYCDIVYKTASCTLCNTKHLLSNISSRRFTCTMCDCMNILEERASVHMTTSSISPIQQRREGGCIVS